MTKKNYSQRINHKLCDNIWSLRIHLLKPKQHPMRETRKKNGTEYHFRLDRKEVVKEKIHLRFMAKVTKRINVTLFVAK